MPLSPFDSQTSYAAQRLCFANNPITPSQHWSPRVSCKYTLPSPKPIHFLDPNFKLQIPHHLKFFISFFITLARGAGLGTAPPFLASPTMCPSGMASETGLLVPALGSRAPGDSLYQQRNPSLIDFYMSPVHVLRN